MRRIAAMSLMVTALLLAVPCLSPHSFAGAPADSATTALVPPDSASAEPQVILYYFHRTSRCETCLAIEAALDAAVRNQFAEALRGGRLRWLPTNIELPENAHFTEDFSLEFNSAVLVRLHEGEIDGWTNLEEVWDLFEDQDAFDDYVGQHVRAALGAVTAKDPDRKADAGREPSEPGS